MSHFIILIFFFIASSCSEPINDAPDTVVSGTVIDKDRDYSFHELTNVCIEGCLYHDKLYRGANKIYPNSVSLNNIQLDSIVDACTFFCQEEVFRKINQKNNRKAISEIDTDTINKTKKAKTEDVKKDSEDEIEYDFGFGPSKPEKQKEKGEAKTDSSLKPFEDL